MYPNLRVPANAPHSDHIDRITRLDRSARAAFGWHPALFPGLLQSAPYASAVLASLAPSLPEETRTARAAARPLRVDALGLAQGRAAHFLLPACALARPLGGDQVLARQLEHLLDLVALRPSLTVQVVADDTEHPGLAGGFTLYELEYERAVLREDLVGTHLTSAPDDVAAYRAAFDDLRARALPPAASLELIDETKGRLCRTLYRPPRG
ncbi:MULTISPECIES: DUF5753 domain-containing protein [unclassified Streptomyces]|uniref:DUF5753 domain-containing protein n=1 Tax=unclassified Streptomyces TaxID=2593676 RepID=UPI00036D175A|nr:DUF5753 domain-containing protein [Streptomyces sp. LaPpAH-202]MYW61332.1 hypothetical protein [Streptomyces sp. SID8370]MYW87279.1 hypothetical protein [Streptomyces sp. SID8371]